jgi:ferredoxin
MAIFTFAPTMLKQLFSKPVTTKYPAEPIQYPEGSRGHIDIDIQDCIRCGLCMMSCPTGAIKVDKAKNTWTINDSVITGEVIPVLENAVKKNKLAGLIDLHTAFTGQESLYMEDGIHPTQQGARKISEIVAKTIDPEAKTEQRGFWMR